MSAQSLICFCKFILLLLQTCIHTDSHTSSHLHTLTWSQWSRSSPSSVGTTGSGRIPRLLFLRGFNLWQTNKPHQLPHSSLVVMWWTSGLRALLKLQMCFDIDITMHDAVFCASAGLTLQWWVKCQIKVFSNLLRQAYLLHHAHLIHSLHSKEVFNSCPSLSFTTHHWCIYVHKKGKPLYVT